MNDYNGHKSKGFWNVSLWIMNDQYLYNLVRATVKTMRKKGKHHNDIAKEVVASLKSLGITHTPDGFPYTMSAVREVVLDI